MIDPGEWETPPAFFARDGLNYKFRIAPSIRLPGLAGCLFQGGNLRAQTGNATRCRVAVNDAFAGRLCQHFDRGSQLGFRSRHILFRDGLSRVSYLRSHPRADLSIAHTLLLVLAVAFHGRWMTVCQDGSSSGEPEVITSPVHRVNSSLAGRSKTRFFSSPPRKRGSRSPREGWIPAFAGVTITMGS